MKSPRLFLTLCSAFLLGALASPPAPASILAPLASSAVAAGPAATLTLAPGVASSTVSNTPGVSSHVQVISVTPSTAAASILVEGSMDGTNWTQVGTGNSIAQGGDFSIPVKGYSLTRYTLVSGGMATAATVNVSFFGSAGYLTSPASQLASLARPATLVVLGDSVEAGTDGTVGQIGGSVSWVGISQAMLGGRVVQKFYTANSSYGATVLSNPTSMGGFGLAGSTISSELTNNTSATPPWGTDALLESPADIVVLPAGENDLTSNTWTSASAGYLKFQKDWNQAFLYAQLMGAKAIVARTPIRRNPTGGGVAQTETLVANYIRQQAGAYGLLLFDATAIWDANGSYTSLAKSGDTIHPNWTGVMLLANGFVNTISPYLPTVSKVGTGFTSTFLPLSGGYNNAAAGAPGTDLGGGFGDGNSAGTGPTQVTDATWTGPGNVYQYTKTAADSTKGGIGTVWYLCQNTNIVAVGSSSPFSVGDYCLATVWVNLSGVQAANCHLTWRWALTGNATVSNYLPCYQAQYPEGQWLCLTSLFKVPASTTSLGVNAIFKTGTTATPIGNTATISVAGLSLMNLTKQGFLRAWGLN